MKSLSLNNSIDIVANSVSLIDGNDLINLKDMFVPINSYHPEDYYTQSETNALLDDKANQSTTYTKTEADNNLASNSLLFYPKTELFTQTETQNKLDLKADSVDVYLKTETDNLLNAKADQITTYTKTETNALVDSKADQSTTYTKTESNDLLVLKLDSSAINNYYTKALTYSKTETDGLLNLKLNNSALDNYYTKTVLDTTFANYYTRSYIDVVLNNYYTKTENDTLLNDKANQSTTYTKSQTDGLVGGVAAMLPSWASNPWFQSQDGTTYFFSVTNDGTLSWDNEEIAMTSQIGGAENETAYYNGTTTPVPDTIPLVSSNGKIKPLIGADDVTVIDNGTYSTIHANFHASSSGGVGEILVAGDGTIKPIDVTGNISITSDIDNVTINVPPPQSEFNVVGESMVSSNGKIKTLITQSPLQISNDNSSVTIGINANDFAYQTSTYTKTETDNLLDDKADQATTYTKQEVDTRMFTKEPLNTALYPIQKGFDLSDPNNIIITLGLDQNFLDDVAGKQDAITDSLSIQGTGDVLLELKADTDNSNENDNPMLRLSQDDGRCATDVGMQETDNSFYINYNNGTSDVSSSEFLVYNRGNLQTYLTNTSTGWVSTSDERLKNVIAPITNTLEQLDGINPVYYNFKADSNETTRLGLMAQEVEKIYPECVQCDPTGNLGIVYQDMIPVLLAAIKELSSRVESLEKDKIESKLI